MQPARTSTESHVSTRSSGGVWSAGVLWAGVLLAALTLPTSTWAAPDGDGKKGRVFRVQGLKSTAEPVKGDVVDGWRIIDMGDKRLVTGAATVEPCGYLRQVVVEAGNVPEGKGVKKKSHLEVPCVPASTGLVPGPARLGLGKPPPPPPVEAPPPPAPDVTLDDPGDDRVAPKTPSFSPVPAAKLTFLPRPKAASPLRPVGQGGVVLVRVEVTKEGETRSALLVKAPHPDVAREALRMVDTTTWYPGRMGKKKVDAVFDHVVKVPRMPPVVAAPDELDAPPTALKETPSPTTTRPTSPTTTPPQTAAQKTAAQKAQPPSAKTAQTPQRTTTTPASPAQPKTTAPSSTAQAQPRSQPTSSTPPPAQQAPPEPQKEAFRIEYDEDGNPKPQGKPPSGLEDDGSGTTYDGKTWPRPKMPFRKGELSRFGAIRLHNARTAFGVGLGLDFIDGIGYGVVRPNFQLHWRKLSVAVEVPLRFQLLDTTQLNVIDPSTFGTLTSGVGNFRTEDWDAAINAPYTDLLRPIRHITWGNKEDRLYVDITRERAHTIGHGQLMRRYTPNVDLDNDLLMAELDAYADFGGIEVVGGPLPIPRVIGGLAFIKPLGLFLDDYFSKSLSVGASYVTDLNTPAVLTTTNNPADQRVQYVINDTPGQAKQFLHENSDQLLLGHQVQGAGVDVELKAVKWGFVDLKLYGDYSHLFFPAVDSAGIAAFNAGGGTVGALLRMSFGAQVAQAEEDLPTDVLLGKEPRELKARHALRFRAEGRVFQPQFLPSYFNTMYEADKYQLGFGNTDPTQRATLPTKFAFLSTQANEPMRAGYYLEASYQWVDVLAITAMYEDAWAVGGGGVEAVPSARNMAVHAETNGLGWLQLFATYHLHNVDDWTKAFQFSTDNELFFMGGRLQILPILFLNLGVQRTYRIDYGEDDLEGHGATTIGMKGAWSAVFDVELGWQF